MTSIKKIVLIGPESTGKTTLAQQLAEYYQTVWVSEYAREYLFQIHRPYEEADLLEMAKGQIKSEEQLYAKANQFLFCDTDLRVIKIWSEHKYQRCDNWILQQIKQRHYDLYFLCGIDIPWEADPLRENPNPNERAYFYKIYQQELQQSHQNVVELQGNQEKRLKTAVKVLNSLHS